MKVIAFNGSPRKKWNTSTLVAKALEGAASTGAETELVHLYDLDFKGCVSCFSCKRPGTEGYGRCAVKDDLSPVLERVAEAEGLILGSPVYFGSETGSMRSFMERLLFPYLRYTATDRSLFPRRIRTGLIYTMNVKEDQFDDLGYTQVLAIAQRAMALVFGQAEVLVSTDTLQFDDYSKYDAAMFDPAHKRRRHEEVFPEDCRKAFDLGAGLVG